MLLQIVCCSCILFAREFSELTLEFGMMKIGDMLMRFLEARLSTSEKSEKRVGGGALS